MVNYNIEGFNFTFKTKNIKLINELIKKAEDIENLYLHTGVWLGYESTFLNHFEKLLKENKIKYIKN